MRRHGLFEAGTSVQRERNFFYRYPEGSVIAYYGERLEEVIAAGQGDRT